MAKKAKTKKPTLTREQSLSAKPVAVRIIERQPTPDGGQRITLEGSPRGVYRWLLRAPEKIQRDFDLDPFGVEVLDMCDGNKPVRYIIDRFAKTHSLHPHEAERAVIAFLRTMMRKGLVTMAVK